MKRLLKTALVAATLTRSAMAVTIDFEAAPLGPLSSFYAGSGVTFANTTVASYGSLPGMSGVHGIVSTFGGTRFDISLKVVATFSSGMGSVAITGIDIGGDGLRMDAYDAAVGGSLVDFDTIFGTGTGTGYFAQVSTASASIRRVEMYQPLQTLGEGILLDDLTFSSSPSVPDGGTTIAMLGMALGGLGMLRRKF